MPPLPIISGKQAVKAFEKDGWQFNRRRGSHMILTKPGMQSTLSIPDHKEIGRGLLKTLIKDSGLSVEEFVNLLKQ
ncbi:MAG: type II toxin-antitoxin system HicA family toxin [Syntrophomonadaceae bacterium]|nr:type II toxin-antitoxin system HicA family toxin [Syntrophomonadaceae bacterium]